MAIVVWNTIVSLSFAAILHPRPLSARILDVNLRAPGFGRGDKLRVELSVLNRVDPYLDIIALSVTET